MAMPGFSAEYALGRARPYRTTGAFDSRGASVTPAAPVGRRPGDARWWGCFRNCYERCVGDFSWCQSTCYWLCEHDPNKWF